jgi:ethanolaminephosphotransferase
MQVKKIVQSTYPRLNFGDQVEDTGSSAMHCENGLSKGELLACKWQKVVQIMSTHATVHPRMRLDFLYSVGSPMREAGISVFSRLISSTVPP